LGDAAPGRAMKQTPTATAATEDPAAPSPTYSRTAPPPDDGRTATPDGMLLVPGGTFVMGADAGGQDDEHPAHRVTLKAFFLDRTEVTNHAYAACVAAGTCRAPDPVSAERNHFGPDAAFRGPEQPVSSISWDDARAYCVSVGKRLPTEAEFERAARGDDQRTYPWGNEPPAPERAVFGASRTGDVGTHPRGAGPYGHEDLAGNVWEWIEDIYDPEAYRRSSADRGIPGTCDEVQVTQEALRRSGRQGFTGSNPIPKECERVLRGGAFNYDALGLRASNRVHHPGRFRLIMSGMRCAKDALPAPDPPK
jgi:formylglycine-generating enzyme required for sulfatase activity